MASAMKVNVARVPILINKSHLFASPFGPNSTFISCLGHVAPQHHNHTPRSQRRILPTVIPHGHDHTCVDTEDTTRDLQFEIGLVQPFVCRLARTQGVATCFRVVTIVSQNKHTGLAYYIGEQTKWTTVTDCQIVISAPGSPGTIGWSPILSKHVFSSSWR